MLRRIGTTGTPVGLNHSRVPDQPGRARQALAVRLGKPLQGLGIGLALLAVGAAALLVLDHNLDLGPYALFQPLVLVAVWAGGVTAGLVTAGGAMVAIAFLIDGPSGALIGATAPGWGRMAWFALSAAVTVSLLESLGQTRNRADATARRAELAAQREEELVNEVAHEVRRPLQPLKTRAELLLLLMARGQRPTDQELKDFLVASTHRVDQAARVLRRLMEAARLEEGKMVLDRRLTNVAAIVSEIVEGARLIDRRHNFTLIAPAVAEARVDPTAIDQVIANLVENAIKFSPRGTEIQVEILDDADGVQIEVRDSGPGVALERRATLFARGTQANGSGQGGGLGLGLYISSRIVEMHGGTIQAIFPDSGGSRFCVWLPKLPSDSTRQTTV